MRGLFKNVANELVQQLTPEDLKEIMDSTIVTVLNKMEPAERLEFSKSIVTNAMTQILENFTSEERSELVRELLPEILRLLNASNSTDGGS